MKIDIFTHILPPKYFAALREMVPTVLEGTETRYPAVLFLDQRLRLMNRHPDVLQVLTLGLQHLIDDDELLTVKQSIELSRMANDEMAEMVVKYPDKFFAAAACLPLRDIDASLEEIDRSIKDLGLKGIQIHSTINGKPLSNPEFKPIWKKMAEYDLPIWIHPYQNVGKASVPAPGMDRGGVFSLVYETSCGMNDLVSCGVFNEYPNIKFIAHHCGAIVPLLEGRLFNKEVFRKFYVDTATYGSTIQIMCGYSFFGAERVLFGTDTPLGPKWGCTLDVIESVERMPVSDEEKDKIFLRNAVNLLNMQI